jgi:hypothetical protein
MLLNNSSAVVKLVINYTDIEYISVILKEINCCCFLYSWNYCGKDTLLEDKNLTYIDEVTITLTMSSCSP